MKLIVCFTETASDYAAIFDGFATSQSFLFITYLALFDPAWSVTARLRLLDCFDANFR